MRSAALPFPPGPVPLSGFISSQGNNKGTQTGTSSAEEGAAERGWAGLITPAPVPQEESSHERGINQHTRERLFK